MISSTKIIGRKAVRKDASRIVYNTEVSPMTIRLEGTGIGRMAMAKLKKDLASKRITLAKFTTTSAPMFKMKKKNVDKVKEVNTRANLGFRKKSWDLSLSTKIAWSTCEAGGTTGRSNMKAKGERRLGSIEDASSRSMMENGSHDGVCRKESDVVCPTNAIQGQGL